MTRPKGTGVTAPANQEVEPAEVDEVDEAEVAIAALPALDGDERFAALQAQLEAMADIMEQQGIALVAAQNAAHELPLFKVDSDVSESIGDMKMKREVTDFRFPWLKARFPTGLRVRLTEESQKGAMTLSYLRKTKAISNEEGLPEGVVLSFMMFNSVGVPKYKVKFPGVGTDGVLETDLVPA